MLEQGEYSERQQLVKSIEEVRGHLLSPRLRQAFLTVSRASFVPTYYVQERPGEWREYEARQAVYQDKALVTKLDENKHPCSSSSMPSVMAAMLEALDVHPGHHVLEIGTGTGYNAALLAELVGPDGCVVSVDIDEELVEKARTRLAEAGYRQVQTRASNGLQGYAPTAPYDRILVTGGYAGIPLPWREQLASPGVLVGNLLGTLTNPLFCLVKEAAGNWSGKLLSTSAFFMPLHAETSTGRPPWKDLTRFETMPCLEEGQISKDTFLNSMDNQSFSLFLERSLPAIERHLRYLGGSPKNIGICFIWQETLLIFSPANGEINTATTWTVKVRGQVPLWSMIQSLYEEWVRAGSPSVDGYELHLGPGEHYSFQLFDDKLSEKKKA